GFLAISESTRDAILPGSSWPSVKLARSISRESLRISLLIFIRPADELLPPASAVDLPALTPSRPLWRWYQLPGVQARASRIPLCAHAQSRWLHALWH